MTGLGLIVAGFLIAAAIEHLSYSIRGAARTYRNVHSRPKRKPAITPREMWEALHRKP